MRFTRPGTIAVAAGVTAGAGCRRQRRGDGQRERAASSPRPVRRPRASRRRRRGAARRSRRAPWLTPAWPRSYSACPRHTARHARHGSATPAAGARRRPGPPARDRARACPALRLLTDAADRESYRLDETAYLRRGPAARGRSSRPTTAEVAELVRLCGELDVPIVPRGAGHRPVGRRGRHRGRADDRLHAHGPDPRDRPREPPVVTQPGVINAAPQGGRRRRGPVLRRPTRRATRCARSAATSAPTPAGCAA